MSYRNPGQVAVVDYGVIGKGISGAVGKIDTARAEIAQQQKEAQAILDEKSETVNDELATENVVRLGSNAADIYKQGLRQFADKEGLDQLTDQGYRELKASASSIKNSVDKIAELALTTDIELSKQFQDKELAAFIGAVREGNTDDVSIEFKDNKLYYSYNVNGQVKTWSNEDILKKAGTFKDIGVQRDAYTASLQTMTSAVNKKSKEFSEEGVDYDQNQIDKDIQTAYQALSKSDKSFIYNEKIPNSIKSGLPSSYNSYVDDNGNKLSTEEIASNREAMDQLIQAAYTEDFNNALTNYPSSLAAQLRKAQIRKMNTETQAANQKNKFNKAEWEAREIDNATLRKGLASIKVPTFEEFRGQSSPIGLSEYGIKKQRDAYNKVKIEAEDALNKLLLSAPVSVSGTDSGILSVQKAEVGDDGVVYLYGKKTELKEKTDGTFTQIDTDVNLGNFKLDGSSYQNMYKMITNLMDKKGMSRVQENESQPFSLENFEIVN